MAQRERYPSLRFYQPFLPLNKGNVTKCPN